MDNPRFWFNRVMGLAPWLLLLAGSGYLVWAAWQVAFSPSMDYAVVVDMARNMATGTDYPTFFYGQAYMGSFEPAVSALLCAIFGKHPFWVCMGSAIIGVATLYAVMRMARRLGGNAASCIAVALATCGGAMWVHFTVSPRGGYALASFLCLSAVFLGSAVEFEDEASGRMRVCPAALFGIAAGLAFWNFWVASPAFVAACAALVFRYRGKVLSPRFFLPATMAFFLASAPWWAWVYRNGWEPFNMNPGVFRPPGIWAISNIVKIVALRFFGFDIKSEPFWRTPFPWPLVAMAALSLLQVGFSRTTPRRRFAATTILYAFVFYFVYAFTSFGATSTARYFIHFVPAFSVVGGVAIGTALGDGQSRRRPVAVAAAVVLASWAVFTAPRSLRLASDLLTAIHAEGAAWSASMRKAAEDPALSQPAFADFFQFGANWVTDRRLCFVSPLRWRYKPYLLRLEGADSPAVINRSQGFCEFCDSTLGRCRTRNVGHLTVSDSISPPPEVGEINAARIAGAAVRDESGTDDVADDLFDDDLGTFASVHHSSSGIDVVLSEPSILAGVTAIATYSGNLRGWRAEALDADGNVQETLAECDPLGGWFWSGPRPFMFGPDCRLQLRWEPRRLDRIRIVFIGRFPKAEYNYLVATISDMRFLSQAALPPLDVPAVASVVDGLRTEMPDARIHAGRWLGARIGASPDPALELGRDGGSLSLREVCEYTTLDVQHGAIAVLRGGAADAAEATLREVGIDFSRRDVGGCAIFAIAPQPWLKTALRLRLYGGRLQRDTPPLLGDGEQALTDIDFGGAWRVRPNTPVPTHVHPGDAVPLEFNISATDPIRCDTQRPLMAFVHAVRDGRILFQGIVTIDTSLALLPADSPMPIHVSIPVAIPQHVAPGPVSLMLCMTRQGDRMRLKPRCGGLRVNRRRAVIGTTDIVPNGNNP